MMSLLISLKIVEDNVDLFLLPLVLQRTDAVGIKGKTKSFWCFVYSQFTLTPVYSSATIIFSFILVLTYPFETHCCHTVISLGKI